MASPSNRLLCTSYQQAGLDSFLLLVSMATFLEQSNAESYAKNYFFLLKAITNYLKYIYATATVHLIEKPSHIKDPTQIF
mgnify:CR=1 FL=1